MTSRRRFLGTIGAAGLGLAGCRSGSQDSTAAPTRQGRASGGEIARVEIPQNRVVVARDEGVVSGTEINAAGVDALLDRAMARVTPSDDPAEAWYLLFRPTDVVAIKVNCLAGPPLSSHTALVDAIATRLHIQVGIARENIIVYDRDTTELQAAGFEVEGEVYRAIGTDRVGYEDEPTTWGEAGSCYSRIVTEAATAIINVPVLKDHDLAGLSGALKNHFGSIHNPNKLHIDHCCPYVADVNCARHIREKHRLVVCDALLVCYDGGPGYKPDTTVPYGAIMAAVDPVAADAVGLSIIEKLRAEHGLPPIAGSEREPKYIQVAADAEHGLGVADLARIEVC